MLWLRRLLLLLLLSFCVQPLFSEDVLVPEETWQELTELLLINGYQFSLDSETLQNSSESIGSLSFYTESALTFSEDLQENSEQSEKLTDSSNQTTGNLETVITDISNDNKELKESSDKSTRNLLLIAGGSLLSGIIIGMIIR